MMSRTNMPSQMTGGRSRAAAGAGPQHHHGPAGFDREHAHAVVHVDAGALQLLEKKSIFLNRAYLFEQDQSKIGFLDELQTKYCQVYSQPQ